MKLFCLKTKFSWIVSLSELDDIQNALVVKRIKTAVRKLCTRLLEIGGDRVVLPLNEPNILFETLFETGQVIPYGKLRIKNGQERECHSNSAELWLRNKKNYKIVTGLGLSDDHVWRRHSWVVTIDGDLIETTVVREIYFGMLLGNKASQAFAKFYLE